MRQTLNKQDYMTGEMQGQEQESIVPSLIDESKKNLLF